MGMGLALKFQLFQAVGWATIATFMTGIIVFTVERLGLGVITTSTVSLQMWILHALPFLTLGEMLYLLFFCIWGVYFIVFTLIGVAQLKRSMP
jgi:hypothetical protein